MQMIRNLLILLVLAWMTIGCSSDSESTRTGYVNTGVENGQYSTGQSDVPNDEENTEQSDVSGEQGNAGQDDTSDSTTSNDDEEKLLKPSVVETNPSNWYIRLVAEDPARAMKSGSSQLGELDESDAVENHALKALSPFGGSYLDIVFVDPDGVAPGEYKSNFHVYQEGTEDHWSFTIKTDDPNTDIHLTWRGLYVLSPYTDDQSRTQYKEYRSLTNPLINQMKLVDTANGNEIAAIADGKVQTYTFNMEGRNDRTFKWVVQTEEVDLPVQANRFSTLRAKAIKKDAAISKEKIIREKAETFDLSKPPMIK